MSARLTEAQIMDRAARGMGKVDQWQRGIVVVSADEIEGMALALAIFGLRPIRPDDLANILSMPPVPLAPLLGPADG